MNYYENAEIQGARLKKLRECESVNLSQEEFGSKIGLTRSSISNFEKGKRNMSEQTLKSICREFKVSPAWLRDGIGDMFLDIPETIIDQLAVEYDLDEFWKDILRNFLKLNESEREALKSYYKKLFNL